MLICFIVTAVVHKITFNCNLTVSKNYSMRMKRSHTNVNKYVFGLINERHHRNQEAA